MSFFENNKSAIKIGSEGEQKVREWFKGKRIPFMQVDIMWKYKGKWCLGEVKSQEKFESPPYDGHGLPEWQIQRRMEFYKDTGVLPYLIVYDLKDDCLYINDMPSLLEGNNFKTKGRSPRVIFDLNNFKKIEL